MLRIYKDLYLLSLYAGTGKVLSSTLQLVCLSLVVTISMSVHIREQPTGLDIAGGYMKPGFFLRRNFATVLQEIV